MNKRKTKKMINKVLKNAPKQLLSDGILVCSLNLNYGALIYKGISLYYDVRLSSNTIILMDRSCFSENYVYAL
jgi:hypothetical protein